MDDLVEKVRREVAEQLKPVATHIMVTTRAIRRIETDVAGVKEALDGFKRETLLLTIKVLAGAALVLGGTVIALVVYIFLHQANS